MIAILQLFEMLCDNTKLSKSPYHQHCEASELNQCTHFHVGRIFTSSFGINQTLQRRPGRASEVNTLVIE